jgi:hypothetical protein
MTYRTEVLRRYRFDRGRIMRHVGIEYQVEVEAHYAARNRNWTLPQPENHV